MNFNVSSSQSAALLVALRMWISSWFLELRIVRHVLIQKEEKMYLEKSGTLCLWNRLDLQSGLKKVHHRIFANIRVFEKLGMCLAPNALPLNIPTHTAGRISSVRNIHGPWSHQNHCCVRTVWFSTCHLSCSKETLENLFSWHRCEFGRRNKENVKFSVWTWDRENFQEFKLPGVHVFSSQAGLFHLLTKIMMMMVVMMIVLIRLIGFGLFSDCSWHKLFPNNYAAKIEQA